ncbi:MAG: TRAP transporter fused permease subunit, partial [Dehalococcoidia bacterium]
GQIMPPVMGATAFLMAEILEVPYWSIVVAAILPAILYYLAIYMQVDFEAAKTGLKGLPKSEIPSLRQTMREGWQFLIPIGVLIFFLGYLGYSASTSGLYALVALLVVSMFQRQTRLTPRKIVASLEGSTKGLLQIGPAGAVVGILVGAVSLTGLGLALSSGLIETARGSLMALLLLAMVASLILGLGLPTIVAYLTLAILVAPALVQMGVEPMAAHLFILYFGAISLMTPPEGLAFYAAAAIAGAGPMRTGFTATRLGIVAYLIPFMFVRAPALILMGSVSEIALAATTAIIGVSALAAGLAGYLFRPANLLQRALFIGGAVALIYPDFLTDIIGAVAIGLPTIWQVISYQAHRHDSETTPIPADPTYGD